MPLSFNGIGRVYSKSPVECREGNNGYFVSCVLCVGVFGKNREKNLVKINCFVPACCIERACEQFVAGNWVFIQNGSLIGSMKEKCIFYTFRVDYGDLIFLPNNDIV